MLRSRATGKKYALRVFLIILATTFFAELVLMVVLPDLLGYEPHLWFENVLDSLLLTLVAAPVVWLLVIRPLLILLEARSALLAQLFAAQEAERQHIARDLHDDVGQSLTSLQVGLRALEESPSLESARGMARQLREIGNRVHESIRLLSRGLRPGMLDDMGLCAALEYLVEQFESTTHLRVQCTFPEPSTCRMPDLEITLYRIAQEALTNIARHAHASHVELTVGLAQDAVTMTIQDDGCGFRPSEALAGSRGMGLTSMRERAVLHHGTFHVQSACEKGTTITVKLPFPHPMSFQEASDGKHSGHGRG